MESAKGGAFTKVRVGQSFHRVTGQRTAMTSSIVQINTRYFNFTSVWQGYFERLCIVFVISPMVFIEYLSRKPASVTPRVFRVCQLSTTSRDSSKKINFYEWLSEIMISDIIYDGTLMIIHPSMGLSECALMERNNQDKNIRIVSNCLLRSPEYSYPMLKHFNHEIKCVIYASYKIRCGTVSDTLVLLSRPCVFK